MPFAGRRYLCQESRTDLIASGIEIMKLYFYSKMVKIEKVNLRRERC